MTLFKKDIVKRLSELNSPMISSAVFFSIILFHYYYYYSGNEFLKRKIKEVWERVASKFG